MKDGKYSSNVQNCDHSDVFGPKGINEKCSEDNIHDSRRHNANNLTQDLPSLYMTQTMTLTNYCLCTCCHRIDIPKSQCIIFKASKYNLENPIVQEALSNRYSIPTSKEYICKKCDKYLLLEKMPINSVASRMRSISDKHQQKCIHCHTVLTENFLTFDKTKYGENTLVNNMTIDAGQNIICNRCHNAILRESLVTCLTCDKTMKRMLTLKYDIDKYPSLENRTQEMLKSQKTTHYICKTCHVQFQPKCTCVCCKRDVLKDICKIYNKGSYDFSQFVVSECL